MTNQHPITPSPDPYRAMCAELLLFSEEAGEICYNESLWPRCDSDCTLQDRARALLAQTESKGPGLKDQPLEQLVCALSYQEKKRLALNPNTAAETLTVLATDKDTFVRWKVANNPNTAAETLTVLATDEDWGVRYSVAHNPNTPLEALPND